MDGKGLADAGTCHWSFSDLDFQILFPDYHPDPEIIGDEIEELLETF